jgi:hypothetical protein
MKRDNIEFLVGWLDALRRDDRDAVMAALAPDLVWQGIRPEFVCASAEVVGGSWLESRHNFGELDALELIGAERHAILHAYGGDITDIEGIPLPDGIYNVFAIDHGRVTRIDDFAERAQAFAAAGLPS